MKTQLKKKIRIDLLLVSKGLVSTHQKAQSLIMAGCVFVNNEKITKAGALIFKDAEIEIRQDRLAYVSRGGLKLEHALREFKIDVIDKVCVDIGASTGGFTDCLLQNKSRMVYCIDVGYGQLDWKIRNDERVINFEKENIRYFDIDKLSGDKPELAVVDVSFISLEKVLPKVLELITRSGEIVALIKPQFEAGREKVCKGGVVKDGKVHEEVISKIKKCAAELLLKVSGVIESPVQGPAGNTEFLIHLKK